MISDDLYRRIDAARVHADLSVEDLWLRYLGCGGSNDEFDLDGFLQGLVVMDSFQRSVLSQTVNEALQDSQDSYSIPLTDGLTSDG